MIWIAHYRQSVLGLLCVGARPVGGKTRPTSQIPSEIRVKLGLDLAPLAPHKNFEKASDPTQGALRVVKRGLDTWVTIAVRDSYDAETEARIAAERAAFVAANPTYCLSCDTTHKRNAHAKRS